MVLTDAPGLATHVVSSAETWVIDFDLAAFVRSGARLGSSSADESERVIDYA